MTASRLLRPLLAGALLLALACFAGACQRGGAPAGEDPDLTRVFGNGFRDASPVIARVGDVEITRADLDRRYAELPDKTKREYTGEGWERRFLRYMIDEVLLFQEAQRRRLHRDPEVAQALISDRRAILVNALRERELVKDAGPTEEQIRNHFERNRSAFMLQGTLHARHIQCVDRQTAQSVYAQLKNSDNRNWDWPRLVAQHSRNTESAKLAGDLGWFNRGGYVPALAYAKDFSEKVWDWPLGLHEPVEIGGDWHVIELLRREPERPMTIDEARDQIVNALTPLLKQEALDGFLRGARRATSVEYFAGFAPGGGMNPRDLIRLAQMDKTPEEQVSLYQEVLDEFGDSEYADDALFLLGNVYLDAWSDIPFAARQFDRLLTEHPDSEYAEQARYILANMGKPDFRNPTSVEDLRSGGQ